MRHIIIGDGATGTTAAYYIRSADRSASITIVSDDPNPAYYRAALTNYLLGELHESQLFAVPLDFYIENGIDRIHARVKAVDTAKNLVTLSDNRQIEYDQLLIATGSRPNKPSFPGAEYSGVMTMRTLQDVRAVVDGIRSGRVKQAVVVGGGPLGIEWVQGLMKYKVHVTYLLRGDMFFDRALDRTASDLVISRLRAEGVDVRLNEEIDKAIKGWDGRLKAVHLKNSKQTIDCQLAGTAIGIRPNIEFLQDSGVEIARDEKRGTMLGVIVDKYMRTNVPNVYAGGDVINRTLGLWEPARLQGRVAGRNMAGGSDVYEMGEHYFATRLYDLDFAGVGNINSKPGDTVLIDFPRGSGRIAYRKLVVRDNKLIGALMVGQRKENVRKYGLFYKKLIEKGTDISPVVDRMLEPNFDLPGWIDSLDLGKQFEAARSLIMTAAIPSPATMLRNEGANITGTFAIQPLRIPKAVLQKGEESIPVEKVTNIGRRPDNTLVIDEPFVSGRHAHIEWREISYVIIDDNSTNGTFVNGKRIAAEPVTLKNGDTVNIGDLAMKFVLISEDDAAKSTNMPEEIVLEQAPSKTISGTIEYNGKRYEIDRDTITLGRDPEANILIEDSTVSFMHAQISLHKDHHYLQDLGSRNGTFVNEVIVATPCVLKDGDIIRLGAVKMKFNTNAVDEPAPSAKALHPRTEFFSNKAESQSGGNLIIYSGSTVGLSFGLKPPSVTVGSDVESNDIVLQNQTVSANHARLDWRDDKWHVTDLQSENGTIINGVRLKPEESAPLTAMGEAQFGMVKLVFIPPTPANQPPPSLPMTFLVEPSEEKVVEEPAPQPTPAPVVAEVPPAMPAPPAESADSAATRFVPKSFPTQLTVLAGPGAGRVIKLVNLPLMIGRNSTPEVQGVDDPLVSRQHLKIILMPDGNIGASDCGSVNGTIHNGVELEADKVIVLQKDDEIRIGSTVLKVG